MRMCYMLPLSTESRGVIGTREEIIERILERHRAYYDIEVIGSMGLVAIASFHRTSGTHLITESIPLHSEEDHEYVYIYSEESIDENGLDGIIGSSLRMGAERISPKRGHRRSMITTIAVCDSISAEAKRRIRRHGFFKSFRFMLHGWMEHRIVAVESSTGCVVAGRRSGDLTRMVEQAVSEADSR